MVYSNSTQSYWSITAVNDIGGGPCIFVLSAYKDIASPGGSPDTPVFQSSTSIGQYTAGIAGVAVDQANHLIFISISTSTFQGAVGSLQTLDTVNETVISTVDVAGAGSFGVHYSDRRHQLFSYRINDGNSQIIGIDSVDWKTGNATTLIPQSALPNLYFFDRPFSELFDEETGEWYFAVDDDHGNNATLFSVNVDTKQVSQTVQLVYPSTYPSIITSVLSVYVMPPVMAKEVEQSSQGVKAEMA